MKTATAILGARPVKHLLYRLVARGTLFPVFKSFLELRYAKQFTLLVSSVLAIIFLTLMISYKSSFKLQELGSAGNIRISVFKKRLKLPLLSALGGLHLKLKLNTGAQRQHRYKSVTPG